MPRKPCPKTDPIEREIEGALDLGEFISYGATYSFVSEQDDIAAKIAKLVKTDPARAITLYETFLAACYMKIEELDDSGGNFSLLVSDLYCGWIKARQAGKDDPDETASQLLAWMDEDDYGFCHRLERDAVKVFTKTNRKAFIKHVRERFDAAVQETSKKNDKNWGRHDYLRRRWSEVLRTLYAAQKDVAVYVAYAEETGLTAKDCHAIAELLVSKRKAEEALSWDERGFEVGKQTPHGRMARYELATLKRDLLTKLGRDDEALDAAWADYRKHPSTYTYDDLMKFVPKAKRKPWHEKAIEAAMDAPPKADSAEETFRPGGGLRWKEADTLQIGIDQGG